MRPQMVVAYEEAGERKGVVVVREIGAGKFGVAVHTCGQVLVAYESEDGAPGAAVVKALREIADAIERGDAPVHDITPIIPQAEA